MQLLLPCGILVTPVVQIRMPLFWASLFSGIAGGYAWQQFSDATALIAAACVIAYGLAVFLFGSSKLAPST